MYMISRADALIQLLSGVVGGILLALGGFLVMVNLQHMLLWTHRLTIAPWGFFLLGIGHMLILRSAPISTNNS